ncbi:MAG: NERD domain-containing protein [Prevotella sp.]|nr:NERD domain-containing protein [Prevotella sp.]
MSPLIYILIVILFGGLFVLQIWYNSPTRKGKRGEERVHNILLQLPDEYFILDDIVLPTDKGTTQIDHIVVSKYGIFAIETKNYRGDIYGDDSRQKWTQIIVTEVNYAKKWWKTYTYVTKNQFYNPVKQALGHVYRIKENLKPWPRLKIIPIIVFTGNVNLEKVESRNHVIYEFDLISTILSYRTAYLSDNDVQNIANCLAKNDIRDFIDNKTHVRNVRYAKAEYNRKISSGICPRCGGNLIERSGKYGHFLGCSNYPHCKFTFQQK